MQCKPSTAYSILRPMKLPPMGMLLPPAPPLTAEQVADCTLTLSPGALLVVAVVVVVTQPSRGKRQQECQDSAPETNWGRAPAQYRFMPV